MRNRTSGIFLPEVRNEDRKSKIENQKAKSEDRVNGNRLTACWQLDHAPRLPISSKTEIP